MGRKIKPVPSRSQTEMVADARENMTTEEPEVAPQILKPEEIPQEREVSREEGLIISILEQRNLISERLGELKDLSDNSGLNRVYVYQ